MTDSIVVPLITLILIMSAISSYGFYRRLKRIQKMQARAAAAHNPGIVYTIPTNGSGAATRPNTGSSILYPNQTSIFTSSTELPPSYEDVTKDSPVIISLPTPEIAPTQTTTTSPAAAPPPTTPTTAMTAPATATPV